MRRIYLFCSAGMSTSMLAKRMQEAADAHGLPVVVGAFSSAQIDSVVESDASGTLDHPPRNLDDRFQKRG